LFTTVRVIGAKSASRRPQLGRKVARRRRSLGEAMVVASYWLVWLPESRGVGQVVLEWCD
jgi:hypothetical protein